jgi:hypothetical protein
LATGRPVRILTPDADTSSNSYTNFWLGRDQLDALSCRFFAANAVCLQLRVPAYSLGNIRPTLAMPRATKPWSLNSLREKLIKIGAPRDVPNRRIRGFAADLRGNPLTHHPAASQTSTSVKTARARLRRRQQECVSMKAKQHVATPRVVNWQFRAMRD